MVDVEFLNQKATKLKSALKNIRLILERGENIFLSTPMYPDRVKYYLVIVYDFLEEISCHLLKEISQKIVKKECLENISRTDIFSEKINRIFKDFVNFRKKLFEENFSYSERELFHLTKEIVYTIDNLFIQELASVVKQLKERAPKLKIPVNLAKINKNLSTMKGEIKRMNTFKGMDLEEFSNSSFAVDRVRYFLTAYIDAALWICRHIARQGRILNRRCFEGLAESGILERETADVLQQISDMRDSLADPTVAVNTEWLYSILSGLEATTDRFIKGLFKGLLAK